MQDLAMKTPGGPLGQKCSMSYISSYYRYLLLSKLGDQPMDIENMEEMIINTWDIKTKFQTP